MSATAADLGDVAALQLDSEGSEASGAAVASMLVTAFLAIALIAVGVAVYRTLRRRSRARRAVDPGGRAREPGSLLEEGRLEGIVPADPAAPERCAPSAPKGSSAEFSPKAPSSGASSRVCFLPGVGARAGVDSTGLGVDSTGLPASGSKRVSLSSWTLSSLFGLSPRRGLSGLSPLSNGFVGSSRPLGIYSVTPDEFMT